MMMKKTLVALALAATTVSGSAMAWTVGGGSGSLEIGGTATPAAQPHIWEVQLGTSPANLDANITAGDTAVAIPVATAIPVLGIRPSSKDGLFLGGMGNTVVPQVDFGGKLDLDSFNDGSADLTLDVVDGNNQKFGVLRTKVRTAAFLSSTEYIRTVWKLYAERAGFAFYGGVGKTGPASGLTEPAVVFLQSFFPDLIPRFNTQGGVISSSGSQWGHFGSLGGQYVYSAIYGAGIESGSVLNIALDNAFTGNTTVQWKASLPVTVSYL